MTFGDTWTISSRIVNDARYAYVRQGYGSSGQGVGDYVDFRYLDTPTAETRNTIVSVPVSNVVDNLTASLGKHTLGIGGNWRLLHVNRASDSTTFSYATTNPSFLSGTPPAPSNLGPGVPSYSDGFKSSYETDYANLVGDVAQVTNSYNYAVTSAAQGSLLPDGAFIKRHFKANEFEYYLQDQWQIRPNLTITFGIRHTILQTPYETSGQQVAPTIDTHTWFTQRETAALQGQIYEPNLSFTPSGPFYGKPGFWPKSKNNIAPRFAIAYAPNPKTSVRAGAGLYFQHYGEGLVNTYDQNGSFGLSSTVSNPAGKTNYQNTPRFTGRNALPYSNGVAPATQTFPYQVDPNLFGIQWGLDSRLKTPYTESFDASIQQALPGGFTLEVAYVGRLGRHLLQSLDLTQPVDYVDPQGGGDYYSAAAQLSAISDQHGGDTTASVPAIPYFEHVFPYMAGFDSPGESATQAIYSDEWAYYRYTFGETQALADIDNPGYCGGYYCPNGHQSRFWQTQFASLYALSTIGMSYYNAAQLTLRHPMSHGIQADVNYTFSKSIDMGSDAERTSEFSNQVASANSEIISTWRPYLNRAVSDFDTRHLITIDSVYGLPFGRGHRLLGGANRLLDGVVGGWQLSGIFRATSSLPFSLGSPGWATDWQIGAYPVVTGKIDVHKQKDATGNPTYFGTPSTVNKINAGVYFGNPVRLPYPGETGERNSLRGDGFLNLDNSLSKSWKLAEYGALKFDWAVYNVTNTNRFDPFSINNQLLSGSTLGTASKVLGFSRRMQFALRYDF